MHPSPTAFGRLYLRAFTHPRAALAEVAARPDAVGLGARAVALTAASYTAVYFFLAHNGGRPTVFQPWLAIDPEVYYRWNLWLHAPSLLLAWVAAAGFAHLLARALGGRGTYEATLAVLGFGLSVSTWWTGLHDLVTTCMGWLGMLDQRAYEDALGGATLPGRVLQVLMLGYLVSFLATFALGVGAAHGTDRVRSALAGVVGFAVYQGVFVIFNR